MPASTRSTQYAVDLTEPPASSGAQPPAALVSSVAAALAAEDAIIAIELVHLVMDAATAGVAPEESRPTVSALRSRSVFAPAPRVSQRTHQDPMAADMAVPPEHRSDSPSR